MSVFPLHLATISDISQIPILRPSHLFYVWLFAVPCTLADLSGEHEGVTVLESSRGPTRVEQRPC